MKNKSNCILKSSPRSIAKRRGRRDMFKQTCAYFFFISFFYSSRAYVAHSNRAGCQDNTACISYASPMGPESYSSIQTSQTTKTGARVLKLHYQSRQTSKLRVEFGVQICFRVCSCTLRCVGIRLIIECKQVRQGGGFCAIPHITSILSRNGMTCRCIPRNSFIPSDTIFQNVRP